MTRPANLSVAERFRRDPFANPPPCLSCPEKACMPDCEIGIAGQCRRAADRKPQGADVTQGSAP